MITAEVPTQKSLPVMLYENYNTRNGMERVIAIIYHPHGPRHSLLPFSVFTVSNDNPTRPYFGEYDFEWCRRDETLFYHNSGSGGSFYLHPFCEPEKKPSCAVWWDHSLVTPTNGRIKQRTLSERTVKRYGYNILPEPIPVLSEGINPFDHACYESVEYCRRCDDWLPTESLCEHVWWCEKCGGYSSPRDRCKHRRDNQ